ncbi:CatB-related O-acetyltransferase [Tabrizicola sp.]|uniref:CatB-related O-acetyltransferase n=1 Tax=Tabrizicola sp. TaxID=2005166 RepID=UPI003A101FF3
MLGGNHRTDWASTFPFGHVYQDQLRGQDIVGHPRSRGDILVGNDVWIGANVTLLSGIEIGDGAVIAATATVTRSVGSYEVWGGNPAVMIRHRFGPEISARLRDLRWWDLPTDVVRRIAPLLSSPPRESLLDELEAIVMQNEV